MFKHYLLENNVTQSSMQNLKGYNLSLISILKISATSMLKKTKPTPIPSTIIIILFSQSFYERNTA